MRWITVSNLEQWADSHGSRATLADLVKNLIRATVPAFGDYRFPVGDASQLPGFDGVLVDALAVPPYVPGGLSVWEVSTEGDPRKKATKDYETRTAAPGSINPREATFVFVTPRRWAEPETWKEERRAGPWADIKIIDGVALEDWLEQCPAVAADFARRVLAIMPEGVLASADLWSEYGGRSQPALTEAVLLAGRTEEAQAVRDVFASGAPQAVLVQGHSPDEALAFAVATIRSADEEVRRFLEARTLVVRDLEAARRIAHRGGLVFLIRTSQVAVSGYLVSFGNCVLVALGNQAPRQHHPVIRLPRAPGHLFAAALVTTMGIEPAEAARLTRECASSPTIFQRRRPAIDRQVPDWCRSDALRRAIVPALLAGGWDSRNEEDRHIVGRLAGEDYEAFEARLQPSLREDDTPVSRIGDIWVLVAPADSFELLAPYVTSRDLSALREVALTVFAEVDPALNLPPDERPYASLKGKTLRHSSSLREGLAGTLLLAAVRGTDAGLLPGTDVQHFANTLIAELPGLRADFHLLASLGAQLPLLMEAAPDPFVAALDSLLETEDAMAGIFTESGLIAPESPHTPLLWGLEILAWSSAYFRPVTRILGALARIDPDGRLANRPLASLGSLFQSWPPATDAQLPVRMRALDALLDEQPEVGWKLLLSLLPERPDVVSFPTALPRWRDFGAAQDETRSTPQVAEQAIAERALAHIGADLTRWQAVIAELYHFSPDARSRLFEGLERQARDGMQASDALVVWSSLRNAAARFRRFASAPWALPAADLERLEALVDRLCPDDLVYRNVWLFDEHFPSVMHGQSFDAIDSTRCDALRAIVNREGVRGVQRLAERARLPGVVGAAAGEVLDENGLDLLLDAQLEPPESRDALVIGLSSRAARTRGRAWCEHLSQRAVEERWPPERIATAMIGWPDVLATWNDAAAQGPDVESVYWSRKPARRLSGAAEDVIMAAVHYAEAGRPADALEACSQRLAVLPSGLIVSLLDGALIEIAQAGAKRGGDMLLHHLTEIFDELSHRGDLSPIEIARREFAWLPLLEQSTRTLTLHQLLASEPRFFVEILSEVYQRRPRDCDEEISEERRARAGQGFRLLRSWTTLPGTKAGQTPDYHELRAWIDAVRSGAREAGRAEVADIHIGQLLAHSPTDADDLAWPARSVRDLIEDLASPEIEQGIATERFNMRGVTMKTMFEGGGQERVLADQVKSWAEASAHWPRVAELLHEMAERWERSGQKEDERAELDKLRSF